MAVEHRARATPAEDMEETDGSGVSRRGDRTEKEGKVLPWIRPKGLLPLLKKRTEGAMG